MTEWITHRVEYVVTLPGDHIPCTLGPFGLGDYLFTMLLRKVRNVAISVSLAMRAVIPC